MKFELSLWKVEKSGLLKYCIYVGLVDPLVLGTLAILVIFQGSKGSKG